MNSFIPRCFLLMVLAGHLEMAWAAPVVDKSGAVAIRKLMAEGKVKEAKEKLFDCADSQNAECQYLLAEWIERGELYQRDLATAKKLYELSYSNGYENAGAAILRLAKQKASIEPEAIRTDSGSQHQTKPDTSTASLTGAGKSVGSVSNSPVTGSATAQRTWLAAEPKAQLKGAPDFFGIRLDELDSSALSKLKNVECDNAESSAERSCEGQFDTPYGSLELTLSISRSRVYVVGGKSTTYSDCDIFAKKTREIFGRPKFLDSKLMKALFKAAAGDESMKGSTIWIWGDENWTAMYSQYPVEGMCSVLLSDTQMVNAKAG